MTLLSILLYGFLFILLVVIVAVVCLLLGKRKYNQKHGIVKEKKVKELQKPDEGKKLKHKEDTASKNELDTDEDYDNAIESLRAASAAKSEADAAEDSDENKVGEDEVIEWKPAVEERSAAPAETEAPAAVVAAPLAEPSEDEWNDEDLELFEARAYSFDEETQSGYITDRTAAGTAAAAAHEEKPAEDSAESIYAFRERKGQTRDPEEDEGVQVFETREERLAQDAQLKAEDEPQKVSSTKYAYFDSVMEKEKAEKPPQAEWQPPQETSESASDTAPPKKKSSMQYIELDLDDKK